MGIICIMRRGMLRRGLARTKMGDIVKGEE